jgi:hypothetical protein
LWRNSGFLKSYIFLIRKIGNNRKITFGIGRPVRSLKYRDSRFGHFYGNEDPQYYLLFFVVIPGLDPGIQFFDLLDTPLTSTSRLPQVFSAISLISCRFSVNEKYLCKQAGISPVIPRQRLSVKWESALYLGHFSVKSKSG